MTSLPYTIGLFGKIPVIIGLEKGGGAKFLHELGLAIDSSADWT